MKKQTVAIVAGGNLSQSFLEKIEQCDVVIGVDRGAWWLIEQEITPDYAIGDFDSVSEGELEEIKNISPNVAQYKVEKDETDLELALNFAMTLNAKSLLVFGGLGSRFDHSLAGIFLLEAFGGEMTLIDEANEISLIRSKKTIYSNPQFPHCSFLALTKTAVLSLDGFVYPLTYGVLHRTKTLGVSNSLIGARGTVTVHKGAVFCIQSLG